MRITFILFFIVLSLGACKNKSQSIPEYVLDKETFSDVIVDFTLAESAATINVLNVQGLKTDTVYAFNPLIDHSITRAKFDTSLYYYSHHPKQFKEVYEMVLEKMSRLQSERK